MRILVTFAVDWEFKPWLRLGKFQPVPGQKHTYRAVIAGSDVRVLLTGVGADNAVRSIRTVADEIPDACIVSGLAGGLKHQHRPGDILVAHSARAEWMGAVFESSGELFSAATECGAKPVNQFISTTHVVRTVHEKGRLGASADAVDMETFAIMKEMSGVGVPSVAIRSVADSAEMDVPCDFDQALDESGRIRIGQVLAQVIGDPRQAWPLARLGVQSSRAAASLARYLNAFITHLSEHKEKMDLSVPSISQ
jgi:adenosylhomocysteine nucleosidase